MTTSPRGDVRPGTPRHRRSAPVLATHRLSWGPGKAFHTLWYQKGWRTPGGSSIDRPDEVRRPAPHLLVAHLDRSRPGSAEPVRPAINGAVSLTQAPVLPAAGRAQREPHGQLRGAPPRSAFGHDRAWNVRDKPDLARMDPRSCAASFARGQGSRSKLRGFRAIMASLRSPASGAQLRLVWGRRIRPGPHHPDPEWWPTACLLPTGKWETSLTYCPRAGSGAIRAVPNRYGWIRTGVMGRLKMTSRIPLRALAPAESLEGLLRGPQRAAPGRGASNGAIQACPRASTARHGLSVIEHLLSSQQSLL